MHLKLEELCKTMSEVEALTYMSRLREEARRDGVSKVTRIIIGGKVVEQIIS